MSIADTGKSDAPQRNQRSAHLNDLGPNQILCRLDFLTIRIFVTIVEEGNFLHAAEPENLAPSTVSRRIQDLEAHLGIPLMIRGPRAVLPTAAGEYFVRFDREDGRISGIIRVWANASSLMPMLAIT